MVQLSDIQAANASLPAYYPVKPMAVFNGATAGIGKATLEAFVRRTTDPKVYIIGRNKASRQEWLAKLQASNTKATIVFLEADIKLIKEAKRVAGIISKQEQRVDLLCMSAGFISFSGRRETAEGLAGSNALAYWTRTTLVFELLPLLNASKTARVISILDSRLIVPPSKLISDDLDLKKAENYSMLQCAKHTTTMTDLIYDRLGLENPGVSFLHTHPGGVFTGIGSAEGMWGENCNKLLKIVWPYFMYYVAWNLLSLMPYWMSEEVAGERNFFNATSASFLTEEQLIILKADGYPVDADKHSSPAWDKNGFRLVTWDCETAPPRKEMGQLKAAGADQVVWEATKRQIEDATHVR